MPITLETKLKLDNFPTSRESISNQQKNLSIWQLINYQLLQSVTNSFEHFSKIEWFQKTISMERGIYLTAHKLIRSKLRESGFVTCNKWMKEKKRKKQKQNLFYVRLR